VRSAATGRDRGDRRASGAGMYIGLGALVVILIIVVLFLALRGR
jgi:hypothetical protein